MSSHLDSRSHPGRAGILPRTRLRLSPLFVLLALFAAPGSVGAQVGSFVYFSVTPDLRFCPTPTCGGFHLQAFNQTSTTCADGSQQTSCYVASADFGALEAPPSFGSEEVIVLGWIESDDYPVFGNLGKLVVEWAWKGATPQASQGTFFQIRDLGIVCVAAPCFSIEAYVLNQTALLTLSGLDLAAVDATPAQLAAAQAARQRGDLLVAGMTAPDPGPAGEGLALIASQFWLPEPTKPRCLSDADCSAGASCNASEICLPPPGCSPGNACPAVCSGYCEPTECTRNAECDASEYCANDGLCRADGACRLEVDCSLPGNDYPHIECVGHGICEASGGNEDACGWQCTNSMCVDLLGYDLGPCDAVLGWGVVGGACVEVSGCESDPFTLFGSGEECATACPPDNAVPALGLPGALLLGVGLSGLGVAWLRRSTKSSPSAH